MHLILINIRKEVSLMMRRILCLSEDSETVWVNLGYGWISGLQYRSYVADLGNLLKLMSSLPPNYFFISFMFFFK